MIGSFSRLVDPVYSLKVRVRLTQACASYGAASAERLARPYQAPLLPAGAASSAEESKV